MNFLIAIDPGLSGGVAWQDKEGIVHAEPMPEGMTAQAELIRQIQLRNRGYSFSAILEKTGTYVPGNSSIAAVTFARHCGHIEAIFYMCDIPTTQISPQKWQSVLPLSKFSPIPKGTDPKAKRAEGTRRKAVHKREIKEEMQRRYPHLKVTLKTADALGILTWGMKR